jgi:hypothetical protein
MGEYIDTVFGPNGIFARRFQGYTPRRGQIELTRAVDRAIEGNAHLMCRCLARSRCSGDLVALGYRVALSIMDAPILRCGPA